MAKGRDSGKRDRGLFLYSAPAGGGAEVLFMECYCFMYMGSQVTMAGKAMMSMMPTI